jgi:D-aspartate ligase
MGQRWVSLAGRHDARDIFTQTPVVLLGDLNLIRPLGMAGIPVILATPNPNDVALRSRYLTAYCIIPELEGPEFGRPRRALADLGQSLNEALRRKVPLFYSSDKHSELICQGRNEIEAHYLLLLNDDDLAWSLYDKERFYVLAQRVGIRVPRTLRSEGHGSGHLDDLREPIVVKPKRKVEWKELERDLFAGYGKARVFLKRSELQRHPGYLRHQERVIVQEYIHSSAPRLPSFHGFADAHSRLLASYCGRKIRTFPALGGDSCFIELTRDLRVEAVGREVIARLRRGRADRRALCAGSQRAIHPLELPGCRPRSEPAGDCIRAPALRAHADA